MSVMPSQLAAKYSGSKLKMFCFPVLGLVFCAVNAWAAAPPVVIDAQQILGAGYNNPQSIAVNNTNQGAVFIADTDNNQIIALLNGYSYAFTPTGFALSTPQALALDAQGDLFIGDTPTNNGNSYGRVIEMTATGGNLTGAAQLIFSGAPLTNPISLALDSTGTLFIGDYPPSGAGAIYSLAAGGTTPQLLNITGLSPTVIPAALVRDSSTNLYIADNGSFSGGVYIAPAAGGAAQPVATQSFVINQPSGLALDTAGDLFILSLLGTGSGYNPGQQVVVVPAASPSNPYILPNNGIGTSSSMAFDAQGNLDVLDSADGEAFQLNYVNPTPMGYVNLGQTGPQILFNFEFNAPTTLGGFRIVSQGDVSTDLTQTGGGNCVTGSVHNLPNGGPTLSPFYPYSCIEYYEGTPTYPGLRTSAILVRGANSTILASTPVYQVGFAGAEITYPLNASASATGLQQPQAVAISGQNNTVYVADTQAGIVYSTSGVNGSTLTPVSTGTISLQAPSALALDAAGDLFIADFNLGEVIEVPTTTGLAPSVVIAPGGLLQHPIALTVDFLGNLYVGDAGPGGVNAGSGNPGYVVKLPAGGAAYKMTLPATVSIVFPQALATDPYNADLFIGDGGDSSVAGQVFGVTPDGSVGATIPLSNVTNPTGLAFDPAEDLYVLDGTANTITVAPAYGSAPLYVLDFDNTSLAAASAFAMSAGGQSFVIANIGTGSSNNLVFVNGNSSTLSFGNVAEGSQSQSMTATEYNIGNAPLTLASPYYTTETANSAFNILTSSTCGANVALVSAASCSINIQFAPVFIGDTSQQITVDSNAYNGKTGNPILTLQGTGTGTGSVSRGSGKRR
jgi:sugar lactone lactonase YvrE